MALEFPRIDPVAVHLGPVSIHWYGITYLVAFALFMFLANRRLRHEPYASSPNWSSKDIEDMLFLGVMGVIIGGRLGYCVFYKPVYYAQHPLEIFAVWLGGMSYHGGMLGVILSQLWYARSRGKAFWQVMDFIAPCVPPGLGAVRIGNFINGELWGRPVQADIPWAMVFPQSGSSAPRHPSQLYEFCLEGIVLFAVMWLFARKRRPAGQVSALYLIAYGSLRFIVEFFREPDAHLMWLQQQSGLSMGQWLCVPMVLAGVLLWLWASRRQPQAQAVPVRS